MRRAPTARLGIVLIASLAGSCTTGHLPTFHDYPAAEAFPLGEGDGGPDVQALADRFYAPTVGPDELRAIQAELHLLLERHPRDATLHEVAAHLAILRAEDEAAWAHWMRLVAAHPPEADIDLDAEVQGLLLPVRWRDVTAPDRAGVVRIDDQVSPARSALAYLLTHVHSERAQLPFIAGTRLEARSTPLRLGPPDSQRWQITYEAPPGARIVRAPGSFEIEHACFRISRETTVRARRATMRIDYERTCTEVSPEDYAELRRLARRAANQLDAEIVFDL